MAEPARNTTDFTLTGHTTPTRYARTHAERALLLLLLLLVNASRLTRVDQCVFRTSRTHRRGPQGQHTLTARAGSPPSLSRAGPC